MKSRYYWQRLRTGPKSGTYRIQDRVLEIHIAECSFKENAELICGALNHISLPLYPVPALQAATNVNSKPSPDSTRHGVHDPHTFDAPGR